MARKVSDINSSSYDDSYFLLSQTPENYDKSNFFIKELQDKVNADWPYRFNRVVVDYETFLGSGKYNKIEVIVQPVKSDTGKSISNDIRRFVFKNIREDRFNVGHKFMFSPSYNPEASKEEKNTWLVTNKEDIKATSTVVIQRCNGTLGSVYKDAQGVSRYHYEPVIQSTDLSGTNFNYNQVVMTPQAGLIIIAQHNEFTKQYFVNERFIVGYDTVYRIKAINKFYSNSTNNPNDVGLVYIYLEITEKSPYDDFETRIAYQMEKDVVLDNPVSNGIYSITFTEPAYIPSNLTEETLVFVPKVVEENGVEHSEVKISTTYELENFPSTGNRDLYVKFVQLDNNSFSLQRLRPYMRGNLVITCKVTAEDSPSGEEIETSFSMTANNLGK